MSGQRCWLKLWARTVGMPVGITDEDKPEFPPNQTNRCKKSPTIPNLLDYTSRSNLPYDNCRQWKITWMVVK